MAAVCRREVPRCEKCAEGLETKECVAWGKEVVCVNCRGAHGAGDQKCPVQESQVELTKVRGEQRVSHAEAVKKIEEDGSKGRDAERICV